MTPSLAAEYEPLLARASVPALASTLTLIRSAVEERIGPFGPNDPWFEERSLAFWDRVLTAEVVLRALFGPAGESGDGESSDGDRSRSRPDDAPGLSWRLRHAHRGLFAVAQPKGHVDLTCLLSGASFRLSGLDETNVGGDTTRGTSTRWNGLLDGTVVPTREGIALLPGHIVYDPASAHALLEALPSLPAPHAEGDLHDVLDALLSLRQELITRSRVRPNQLFRAEALKAALRKVKSVAWPRG